MREKQPETDRTREPFSNAVAAESTAPVGASSLFTPPTLPSGGGAIRGIGEKLSPNLVTGTGSLTIPLYATPSRGGFHPDLTLSYDSGGGNGPFGIGWRLPVLSITRRTDKGLPRYEDANDSDIFLLSGFEDLVPSQLPEDDFVDKVRNVRARRYRPRVEGSFTRLERLTDLTSGDVSWSLTMHDGTVHRFGVSADARVFDPLRPWRIFQWCLEESRDLHGNVVQYVYKREDNAQIPLVSSEASRRGHTQSTLYLKRVYYGNRAPNDTTSFCFQIVFDYGEHGALDPTTETGDSATWPTPDDSKRLWSYRTDSFSYYRATFEQRTRRLCRRVLVFHRFDELGDGDWTLCRSNDFTYAATPVATYLHTATQTGFMPGTKTSLPALELGYAQPTIDTQIRELAPLGGSLEGLRGGIEANKHAWVDLDGEGISGLLYKDADAWWYKRNLGNASLSPPTRLPRIPSRVDAGPPNLTDLAGAGVKDLVIRERESPGFYERTADASWKPFQAFAALPNLDFADPNLRELDLDGDGLTDVLVNEDDAFIIHLSEGRRGYGPGSRVRKSNDERLGPVVALEEPEQTIFLADMTGDGLTDLVRIRNGEIVYWPNLGYGHFGAKVTMSASPRFDSLDAYDPKRLRLGDIDGSGTTDIVYLRADEAVVFFNQAGNGWSDARQLNGFPVPTNLDSVALVDLLGNGTACLVLTSPAPISEGRPLRYLDLMGGVKPHLLISLDNHFGRQVTLTYASSTQFYLADRLAGTPWLTRLPFPVHVVVRVETRDLVARTRMVTRYAYHHGYFDGFEREFRGFGRVDAFDAESFGVATDDASSDLDLPTVVTKSWFHTGVFPADGSLLRHLAHEYYAADPVALEDTQLPQGLGIDDTREACRSLKGKPLREEVYALDGTPKASIPYVVREYAYSLVPIELAGGRPHGVWFSPARESIEIHYERNADDPRITHNLTLAIDAFGNVTDEANIAYERLVNVVSTQGQRIVTYAHHAFANVSDATSFLVGLPVRSESFEVLGLPATTGQLISRLEIAAAINDAYSNKRWIGLDEPWSSTSGAVVPVSLRELSRTRTLYWNDPQTSPLPEGSPGTRALSHSTQTKTLSSGQAGRLYSPKLDATAITTILSGDCKLVDVDADGGWWAPSAVVTYDNAFYQPIEQTDPFGNVTTLTRDPKYQMFVITTVDPVKNITRLRPNYRVCAPEEIVDPNGTVSIAGYDAVGMLLTVAVTGSDGAGSVLAGTTFIFENVLDAWDRLGKPSYIRSQSLNEWGSQSYQDSYTYTDGSGREAMKKVQAEPGLAPQLDSQQHVIRDPKGEPVLATTAARWVGTGRTVYDNKGNPIKRYEPYFSATSGYEDTPDLVEWGVTQIMHYDPLDRVIRTDFPDGTLSRVEFDAWGVVHWDQNDTVAESDWYRAIVNPPVGSVPSAQLVRSATLALKHNDTPTRTIFDPLRRAVSTLVDIGNGKSLETMRTYDAAGNVVVITDPRNLTTVQTFNLVGQVARSVTPDAGDHAAIFDAVGALSHALTAKGYALVYSFDEAHRPTRTHLRPFESAGTTPILIERTIWGEALDAGEDSEHAPNGRAINARARIYQRYDSAGLEVRARYDLRGNLRSVTRTLTKDYTSTADWSVIDDSATSSALATVTAAALPLLEDETFTTATDFDARDRATRIVTPDGSQTLFTFNDAGLLETVAVCLRNSIQPTSYITNLNYNERGQRTLCQRAHGIDSVYDYDPQSFRLRGLKTSGTQGVIQNCSYTYDPVGNVVQVDDSAEDEWFGSAPSTGSLLYEYDAGYRLISASGREQGSQGQLPPPDGVEVPLFPIPDPTDTAKVRQYQEHFTYDDSGNLRSIKHVILNVIGLGGWTRDIPTDETTNRLSSKDATGVSTGYGYDEHGNLAACNGQKLTWNYADRLQSVDLGGGGVAYYSYDADGNRLRKVIERTSSTTGALVERRDYVGSWERFRRGANSIDLERETLRVVDDKRCIALIETKTKDVNSTNLPDTLVRWQIDNHLGSVGIELDDTGAVISYEEYYSYGGTAYLAGSSLVASSAKRYRYNARERDDETGFQYYGARYYIPWLGKWSAIEPKPKRPGESSYAFNHSNPVTLVDPDGKTPIKADPGVKIVDTTKTKVRVVEVPADRFPNVAANTQEYLEATGSPAGMVTVRQTGAVKDLARSQNLEGVKLANATGVDAFKGMHRDEAIPASQRPAGGGRTGVRYVPGDENMEHGRWLAEEYSRQNIQPGDEILYRTSLAPKKGPVRLQTAGGIINSMFGLLAAIQFFSQAANAKSGVDAAAYAALGGGTVTSLAIYASGLVSKLFGADAAMAAKATSIGSKALGTMMWLGWGVSILQDLRDWGKPVNNGPSDPTQIYFLLPGLPIFDPMQMYHRMQIERHKELAPIHT